MEAWGLKDQKGIKCPILGCDQDIDTNELVEDQDVIRLVAEQRNAQNHKAKENEKEGVLTDEDDDDLVILNEKRKERKATDTTMTNTDSDSDIEILNEDYKKQMDGR